MPVTQREIARQAGVTQKTVSLYFSGSRHIAPKTKEKIKQVSDRLGYFPNQAALSIRSKQFMKIALIVVQRTAQGQQSHPQLLSYINTAARELARFGFSLIHEPFYIDPETFELAEKPNFFKTLSVDGIIGVAGTYVPPVVDEVIESMGPPIVWLNRYHAPGNLPHIDMDEQLNGELVGEYLKEKGYKSVAWFGPDFLQDIEWHYSSKSRFEGVKRICDENNIELKPFFARVGKNLYDASIPIFEDSIPEALIGYNFDYADSAQYRMMEKGLKHPDNTEIIKFSSSWETNTGITDKYTMLQLPENDLSQNGVKYILSILNNKKKGELLLPLAGKLIKRKS